MCPKMMELCLLEYLCCHVYVFMEGFAMFKRESWKVTAIGCIDDQPALKRINRNLTFLNKIGIISDYEMVYNPLVNETRIFFNFLVPFKKLIGKCICGVKIGNKIIL